MSNTGIPIQRQGLLLLLIVLLQSITAIAQPKIREIEYESERPEQIDSFRTLHLMIAGNIYQSEYQIAHAFDPVAKKYDFSDELRYVNPILNLGDVVIANMKTGFTGENANPFSSPDELALAMKYSGINNCVMANLNTAYLDKKGMIRTKKALDVFDIRTTGAFADNIVRNGNYPLIINRKGFKIAMLNYTSISHADRARHEGGPLHGAGFYYSLFGLGRQLSGVPGLFSGSAQQVYFGAGSKHCGRYIS